MTTLLKKTTAGLALALGVLACGTADAAYTTVPVINGAGGGGFWDNTSNGDGPERNVGYFLTKTGAYAPGGEGDVFNPDTGFKYNHFSPNIALGNLQYLNASGFVLNDSPTQNTQIQLELASFRSSNQLWYWNGGAGSPTQVVFTDVNGDGEFGEAGDTGTITVTPGGTAALIILETENNRAFASDGTVYEYTDGFEATWWLHITNVFSKTNFAAFVDGTGVAGDGNPNTQDVWIGIEDMLDLDDDYNDMIINLRFGDPGDNLDPNAVPAPPALVLALAGVLPCLALRRRLRSQTA